METTDRKPLGKRAYGSIPHLPNSRLGPSDKQANPGHVKIATEKPRDKHDRILVQEKLDGSNVSVAKLDGRLIPLTRAGYLASTSPFLQHKYWEAWVYEQIYRFDQLLNEGEWCCGEWCIQAHGTRYAFKGEPFFLFDLFSNGKRIVSDALRERNNQLFRPFETPKILHFSGPYSCSVDNALSVLGSRGHHGALDPSEGAIWRVERKGVVDFLVKFVWPDKIDGKYLESETGGLPVWNLWQSGGESIDFLMSQPMRSHQQ